MSLTNRSHEEKGFALLDALVAVFLVATGLSAALDMITHMQTEMDMYKKYMLMGMLAQSKLEQIDAAAALPTSSGGDFESEFNVPTYRNITYTTAVTPITSAGLSASPYDLTGKSVKVEITVKAYDLRGKQHQIKASSIKTIRGG
ncbi:MAG: hypothetical protein A3G34_13465 [Candidatus Lindowbacteria bacterium RIFCSPLOWO2_12_FULL_62_27]|nr:MAG: hypothetical protein A3I06_10985 [Candidatus Lindowbacteria bacterium RIFCSPLOWO2_02_FULL_62_12]OGH62591.1 MAG: hypothetical protein A3G34_13465 [Candidatus Lindowbacteria bacterium RIFCSPLOWO2_12_FULL_62_27]